MAIFEVNSNELVVPLILLLHVFQKRTFDSNWHRFFLQAGCHSCHPASTSIVKVPKGTWRIDSQLGKVTKNHPFLIHQSTLERKYVTFSLC